uniref:Uncharacterized protein n=1 Tax=Paramormyrops kingsleyae TaxID=1676925 RepID=A0A3B3QEH6_9TELE
MKQRDSVLVKVTPPSLSISRKSRRPFPLRRFPIQSTGTPGRCFCSLRAPCQTLPGFPDAVPGSPGAIPFQWCLPCLARLPELRKASVQLFGQVKFGTLDCAAHEELCKQDVPAVPVNPGVMKHKQQRG